MSIIIKGIDLPEEGKQITLAIFHDGDIVSYKYWLPKDSQAIQIPKGHGRLIDEKEILSPVMCRPKSLHLDNNAQYNIITLIDEVPTILEKEEE